MYAWIVSGVLAGAISVAGYIYYTTTQNTIEELSAQVATQAVAIELSNKTIIKLQDDAVLNENAYIDLEYRYKISEEYQDSLLDVLHKHDLTNLASKKPGLIESRVNEGTKNVLNDLERITSDDNSQ